MRRNILAILIKSGFQITPDALDYILDLETPLQTVELVISSKRESESQPILSREYIKALIEFSPSESSFVESQADLSIFEEESDEAPTTEAVTQALENDDDWQFRIEKNPDQVSVGSEGTITDFLALFQDRFMRIWNIYKARIDTQNAVFPSEAKRRRASINRRTSIEGNKTSARRPPSLVIIGIVNNKSIARKSRNVVLNIEEYRPPRPEDRNKPYEWPNESITCVIPTGIDNPKRQALSKKADSILLDEVVCISGYVDSTGRMIADDVLFPDIPTMRRAGHAKKEVYAAFISDLHCGSQEFLEDEFDRFIDWLNGRDVDSSDKNMVEKTKYLFIAGDLVDGISVYPNQRDHLKISSLYDQYATIASKLKSLPKRIKVVCIPGNHDACRQALPKSSIQRAFAEPLYELENVSMLGDPCQVIVEDVRILITHGDSMDDLVTTLPQASYTEPAISMIELLKKRHLAPIYGGKTELAPLHRDWMVIDTPPDVVHFGHAHHNAIDNYRGVQIINSGTFQSQTDFMRKQGVVPTPGNVTFMNLRTGVLDVKLFYTASKQ